MVTVKRLIAYILIIVAPLVYVSCVSNRGIHFVNLTAKESPSETELILTTTDPIRVKHTKLKEPPNLIISFPDQKIFGSQQDELVLSKGPIKKIRYEYTQNSQNHRQLSRMIVELTEDLPYKITQSGSSTNIKIKNSEGNTLKKSKTPIKPLTKKEDSNAHWELGYLIGPGDILNIEVWKQADMSREVVVNYKGEIKLPPIRKIKVMGLTAELLEEQLEDSLSRYLLDPLVLVTIKEYNSLRVTVLGEVATGMYTLKRKTSLVEFLGKIGGFTEKADIRHIRLIKKDGSAINYDMSQLQGNPQKMDAVILSGGDTVYVPPLEFNKVYVLGEVKEPKIVHLKGKFTVVDAITEAGGYTREAVLKSIIVIRGELGSQRGIRVNLKRVLKEADISQNIELVPGDIVYVPKTFLVDVERFVRIISAPVTWYFWNK